MDDMYPNDGAAFLTEPVKQVNERKEEKAELLQALPLVQDIIKRFKQKIVFYESIKAIPAKKLDNPEAFMHTVAANKLTVDNLRAEKEWLEGLIEEHFKR